MQATSSDPRSRMRPESEHTFDAFALTIFEILKRACCPLTNAAPSPRL
jgi:hypothetical protein